MPQFDPSDFFDNASEGILLVEKDILQYINSAAQELLAACGVQLETGAPLPQGFLSSGSSYPPPLRQVGNGVLNVDLRPFPSTEQPTGFLLTLRPVASEGLPAAQLNQIIQHLRSPISTSLMATDLLSRQLEQVGDSGRSDSLNALRRSQYRLLRTTHTLQMMVDLADAQKNFPCEPMDLAGLLRELVLQVEGFLTAFPFSIHTQFPPTMLISGHEQLLRQLILSMISNAIAGKADTLTITLKKKGSQVLMVFKDNGQGMSDEALRCSHLPMVAENPLLTSLSAGLPLCRQIAALHKGSLLLKTDKSGTTCTLSLPALQESDPLNFVTFRSPSPQTGCEDVFLELSEVIPDFFYNRENLE